MESSAYGVNVRRLFLPEVVTWRSRCLLLTGKGLKMPWPSGQNVCLSLSFHHASELCSSNTLGRVLSSGVYLTKEGMQTCVAYSPQNLASLPAQRLEQAAEDRKIFLCPKAYHFFWMSYSMLWAIFCVCVVRLLSSTPKWSDGEPCAKGESPSCHSHCSRFYPTSRINVDVSALLFCSQESQIWGHNRRAEPMCLESLA